MRGGVRAKTSDIEKVQQACIEQEEVGKITLARERTGVQKATPLTENGERFPEIAQRFQKIGYRFLAEEAFSRTELIDTGRKIVGEAEKLYSFSVRVPLLELRKRAPAHVSTRVHSLYQALARVARSTRALPCVKVR